METRSTLYSRYTIRKVYDTSPPHGFTHVQIALSCIRCMDLYNSLAAGCFLTHRLCTHQRDISSDLCSRCTIPKTRKPLHHHMHVDHSCSNRIIVHPLYGYARPLGCGRPTSAIGSIHMLWRPVARYTVGIRSGKPMSLHHPMGSLTCKPHYRAPAVRICTDTRMRMPYINHALCTHLKESSSTF